MAEEWRKSARKRLSHLRTLGVADVFHLLSGLPQTISRTNCLCQYLPASLASLSTCSQLQSQRCPQESKLFASIWSIRDQLPNENLPFFHVNQQYAFLQLEVSRPTMRKSCLFVSVQGMRYYVQKLLGLCLTEDRHCQFLILEFYIKVFFASMPPTPQALNSWVSVENGLCSKVSTLEQLRATDQGPCPPMCPAGNSWHLSNCNCFGSKSGNKTIASTFRKHYITYIT